MNPIEELEQRFVIDNEHYYILGTDFDDTVVGACSLTGQTDYTAVIKQIEYFKTRSYQVAVLYGDTITIMRDEEEDWEAYLYVKQGTEWKLHREDLEVK